MSDDIFREVEEEVRRERLEKIWKEYGDYIVAAVSVLLLAVAAYRLWSVYQAREAATASERFIAAQQLLQTGQAQTAAQQFAHLAQTAPGGYAKVSLLLEADALAASGNTAAALANYRKLVDGGDEMLSSVARIRVAWLTVDSANKSEVQAMLGGLVADTSPWHAVTAEILAYADYRAGNTKKAMREFKALSTNSRAPAGVRGRSQAMVTFLGAGGAENYGKPLYPELPGTLIPGSRSSGPGAPAPNPATSAPAVQSSSAQDANTTTPPPSNGASKDQPGK